MAPDRFKNFWKGLTTGEMKGNWQPTEIGLQVNFGRKAATRAAERLIVLPPFCARRRDMGAHYGGIEHLHQMCRLA